MPSAGITRRNADIENSLGYHPATPETAPLHDEVRESFIGQSIWVNEHIPDCREKSLALTALQEAMMWTNAAVAIHGAPLATDDQRTTPQPTHGQGNPPAGVSG